jgi:hypothetical protein
MAISADGAADRVEQLIALTERIIQLLELDLRDFAARRPLQAAARAEESGRLANLYRHESLRVKRDPKLIAGAPEARRAHLTQATRTLEDTLQRHGRALLAAKSVTEGLVRAIAEEAATQRASTAGYGPGARTALPAGAVPFALNRKA